LPESYSRTTIEIHCRYQGAVDALGEDSVDATIGAMHLCTSIQDDIALADVQRVCVENNWPCQLDWANLPKRIMALSDQLSTFTANPKELNSHFIFKYMKNLLEERGISLSSLAAQMEMLDITIPG
jgi:hypothetical protein